MIQSIYRIARPLTLAPFAGLALALAACGGTSAGPGPSPDGVDLRGSRIGGDFTLTAGDGKKVSWSDFNGKYRMIYFGYTFCPDICPTDVQRFSQGLSEFEKAHPDLGARVQPIFVTVDPERDTPEKVAEFAGNFHPRLIGLTGTPDEIAAVEKKFAVIAKKGPVTDNGGYLVDHSTFTYLFGPDGKPLGIIPTDKGPDGVKAELERWVR